MLPSIAGTRAPSAGHSSYGALPQILTKMTREKVVKEGETLVEIRALVETSNRNNGGGIVVGLPKKLEGLKA